MFIVGSVAPAQIDAVKDTSKRMRSLLDAYENILYSSVSSNHKRSFFVPYNKDVYVSFGCLNPDCWLLETVVET
jgi:hypothetical protein